MPQTLTVEEAAAKLKVSATFVDAARKLKREVEPHIVDMVRDGTIKLGQAQAMARYDVASQRSFKTPEQVIAAASSSSLLPRGMARKTPEGLVATIVDAAGELAVRGDMGALAAGIVPKDARGVLDRVDAAIKSLVELRNAVRARSAIA